MRAENENEILCICTYLIYLSEINKMFLLILPICFYPIYTCTLAMAEPWPSEVLFTPGELYPRQTGQPREDCLGEGQVQTHTLAERAFLFICSICNLR